MRYLLMMFLVFFAGTSLADSDRAFRFGGQLSGNSYTVDDPSGKTAAGSGVSFSGVAFYEVNRSGRLALDVNKGSYTLAATSTNIGQDVSDFGGSLSYQSRWRLSRDLKPWVGGGIGYASTQYTNRHTLTPSGLFSVPYADRAVTGMFYVLNTNVEWDIDPDFTFGLNAQFRHTLSGANQSFRLGAYVIY